MNLFLFYSSFVLSLNAGLPLVITTWNATGFQESTLNAFNSLSSGRMFALVEGLSTCERRQCDTTVGYGGSPDESGEVTLDAMVMDSVGHRVASVANVHQIKDVSRLAWAVMNYTKHTMLVGDAATKFGVQMGFQTTNLSTDTSEQMMVSWKTNNCQPNFWKNVIPDSSTVCGPYKPSRVKEFNGDESNRSIDRCHHDTIGMVVIDEDRKISAGTSTNGARYKIPGRVGDSPIPGAGAYLDEDIGGAACTGDGDLLMRFLPSYQTVEFMRAGTKPTKAARKSILRILKYYANFSGAIVAADVKGNRGAACAGMKKFTYSYMEKGNTEVKQQTVQCLKRLL